MEVLPKELAELFRHGVATKADVTAVIGLAHQRRLLDAGVVVPGVGRLLIYPPKTDLWTPILEVQLRCRRAVASDRLAAWMYQLAPFDGRRPCHIEFVAPGQSPLDGVRRALHLEPMDIRRMGPLRVTTPARTLADLGRVVDDDILERAGESLLYRKFATEQLLWETAARVARHGRTRGNALLRFLQRRGVGTPPTESDLETRFLQLTRRLGFSAPYRQLPVPQDNGKLLRVDFAWRTSRRLVFVEVDGAATHANPDALIRDLRRQNILMRCGPILLRFTADDVDRFTGNIERELGLHVAR